MRVIELTRGRVCVVDDEDFEYLAQYRWCFAPCGYAMRNRKLGDGPGPRAIYMHRAITGAGKGQIVDHRNMDTVDNRRENLRLATKSENQTNSGSHKDNKLGAKGVHLNKGKFSAKICKDGKTVQLGRFETIGEASEAYIKAAKEIHGDFARGN